MGLFDTVTGWFGNKTDNALTSIEKNAGDVLGAGAGAARIISRFAESDKNVMDVAESFRSANDSELEQSINLIMAKYKDSYDYVADSGSFMTQNFWLPVVSFFQEMFGMETAIEKLEKHKDLIANADKEIAGAIDEHTANLDHKTQHVLKGMISESGQDINAATDEIFNTNPSNTEFNNRASNNSEASNDPKFNQAPPKNVVGLEFNYDMD